MLRSILSPSMTQSEEKKHTLSGNNLLRLNQYKMFDLKHVEGLTLHESTNVPEFNE